MVTVRWSNDSTTSAPTWEALTTAVAAIQWHQYTVPQMRHVLAKRAYRWSNVQIDPDTPDHRAFWIALADAKLVIIEKDDDDEGEETK